MTSPLDLALPAPKAWFKTQAFSTLADQVLAHKADYRGYDTVMDQLADYDPALQSGMYNHAPMVIEALYGMGQGNQALAWLETQPERFKPRPAPQSAITEENWVDALGQPERYSDWLNLFEHALSTQDWTSVLSLWVNRLAAGFSTSAVHAALQTAHAVRPLSLEDTPARRRALANGLAAWAARHRRLPVQVEFPQGYRSMSAILDTIHVLDAQHAPGPGMITAGFQALVHAPDFAGQVGQLDLGGPVLSQFDRLIVILADMFLDLARSPFTAIVFTHALTGTDAARTLAHHVPDTIAQQLLFRAFETALALKVAFAPHARSLPAHAHADLKPFLVDQAVATGDDHAIKLTGAMIAAYQRTKSPKLLAVSTQITELLTPDAG